MQSCMNFVVELLSLKQKVLVRSQQEETPFDKDMLTKQLMKTMYSGMKNTNIRSEVRENCRGIRNISQAELLKIVGEAVSIENSRNEKFSATKKTSVNAVSVGGEDGSKPGKNKENYLPAQVQELKVAHETQMAGLKSDMDELKSLLTATVQMVTSQQNSYKNCPPFGNNCAAPANDGMWKMYQNSTNPLMNVDAQNFKPRTNFNRKNNRGRFKNCVENNVYKCVHCLLCCQEGHRANECPNKQEGAGAAGNENRL